jgi:hypothetical protein
MIVKHEKKGGIDVYYVKKNITDAGMEKYKHQFVTPSQIDLIINGDADVFAVTDRIGERHHDGRLLLKFRKGKLSKDKIDTFYENMIDFARTTSTNRKLTSGLRTKTRSKKEKDLAAMTNIVGYFDSLGPSQKALLKRHGMKLNPAVRETRFNMLYPDKFKKLIPLIREIDSYYEKIVPDHYKKQHRKAKQTHFKIADTAFTTVTTNVNYKTAIHTDRGDDAEGFGNLVVIERGKYTGAETCFPQYGVGVNVRTGDVLFMDVHEWHGNLPIHLENKDAVRLSIVCYLRHRLWEKTRGKTKKFMKRHVDTYRRLHDLTANAPKPSANKGGYKNDGVGGEFLFGNNEINGGMAY